MAEVLRTGKVRTESKLTSTSGRQFGWRKRMSDNVAYALLVYTGLQIFVTIHALRDTGSTALPMFALIVLVAGIIPVCRRFERRWEEIGDDAAHDLSLKPAFRRDQMVLWILAVGLPFILTALFKGLLALA